MFGSTTLSDINSTLKSYCEAQSPPITFSSFQSNHEGAIIGRIHDAHSSSPRTDAIVINAGGLTHTSVALRDALAAVDIPFVEIHMTNVHAREKFRHVSLLSEKAVVVIRGLGAYGYIAALEFCIGHLKVRETK